MSILQRATELLQLLASEPGKPWTPNELSSASGIPPAGCTRVLQQLVALSWVDQAGRRAAYRLGPRAYSITAGLAYQQPILATMAPVMRQLAQAYPQSGVVLASLHQYGQHILWECGAFREPEIGLGWMQQVPWHGPCCRVLVAHLPSAKRQQWINRVGLPSTQQWPEIADRAELFSALAEIRRQGYAATFHRDSELHFAAVIVQDQGHNHALGIYTADSDAEELGRALINIKSVVDN